MKKITFWLLSFLAAVSFQLNAQNESFETTAVGSVPNGWSTYQSESDDPGFQVMDQNAYAHDGTNYLAHEGIDLAAESTSWVVTNVIHVGNGYELTFYWRGRWSNSYNFTAAYISTGSNDPVSNPGDFTQLEEYSPGNFPNTWLQWNKAAYDLSSYANQDIYIAFKYAGDHAHDFFIDEVNVAPMPYCELPDNLSIVGRGLDYLDVEWDAALGVNEYEVVWDAPGFNPDTATNSAIVNNATNYQITGLAQSTSYEIYVRSYCSSYNQSAWFGPITGITSGPPPANDDCDNATPLTVNPDLDCVNVTHGTTLDATASSQPDDVTGTPNDDVWFSFVATQTNHKISLLNVVPVMGSSTDMGMGLYDGSNGCNALTLVADSDPNDMIVGGLTVGNTYYLRVYGWFSSLDYAQEFDVCVGTPPPPPANDECSGAIDLNVYDYGASSGNETAGDTTFATDSGNHPSCDDYGTNLDVWYTFTVPAGADSVIVLTGGMGGDDIEAALLDGCGGTELDCQGNSNTKIFNGLVAGTTYTLQVWHDDFNAAPYTIAIEKAPSAPANDDCSGAIDLTVYDYGAGAGNETDGNTTFATDSGNHPSCDDYGTNLDVWYTFTVPAGETSVIVKTGGSTGSNIEAALYDSCGGTELDCQNNGSNKLFSGLTAGTSYTLQVWHDDFNAGPFNIVLEKEPSGSPANDDCDNATALTVNPDDACGVVTHGSTVNATASSQTDDVTGTPNNDVWFSFVATNDSHIVSLLNVSAIIGTSTDMGMGLYDGSNGCSNLSLVQDSDPNSMIVTGLTVGTTYYLRVYGWNSSNDGQEFDVCIGTPPPPPVNDTCANAEALTVNATCTPVSASNYSATDSGEGDPGCASYSGGDLWYTIQVPASGHVTVETTSVSGSSVSDTGMAVYDGSCGALNLIDCDDDGGSGLFSSIELNGLTPGETLYVRVWEYGNNSFGAIGICAYDASSSVSENEIKGLEFYPNPVSNTLNIQAKQDIQAVHIYNISGQEVLKLQPNTTEEQIDMSHLTNGMYFVKVQINGQLTAFKVVKK